MENFLKIDGLTKERLLEAAQAALQQAYAPYSQIRVGAAVLADSGHIYAGSNVENSSYSLTVCAERNAIFHALAHGEKHFLALAVVTDSEQVKSPCGACRQVIAEFAPQLPVVFTNPQGTWVFNLSELLPQAFSLKADLDA
jgi:cytidine deaminase